jgi:gas vesicle protein
MKEFFSFLSGVLVGAVVALLFAPMTGEDLRRQIQEEADAELKRVDAEWQKVLGQINKTVEETQAELKAYIEKAQSEATEEEEEKAAA